MLQVLLLLVMFVGLLPASSCNAPSNVVIAAPGCNFQAATDLNDVTLSKYNNLQRAVEQTQEALMTDGSTEVSLALGLADDRSNQSAEVKEISVKSDHHSAFTDPSNDTLLDLSKLGPAKSTVAGLPGTCTEGDRIQLTDGAAKNTVVVCDDDNTFRCPEDSPRQGIIDPECPPYNGDHHLSSTEGSANDTAIPETWERWKDLNDLGDRACIVFNGSFATNSPLELISKSSDPHGGFTSPFPCVRGPETMEGGLLTGNAWGTDSDLLHIAANEGHSNANNFNLHHLRFRGKPTDGKPSNCLVRLSRAFQGRVSNIILESTYHCGLGFSAGGGHVSLENILIRQEGIAAADMSSTGRFLRIVGKDIRVDDVQCEATTADIPLDMMHVGKGAKVSVSNVTCTEEGVDAGIFFEDANDSDCEACSFLNINLTTRGNGWEFQYNEQSGQKSLDKPGWTLEHSSFLASTETTAPHDWCFRTSEGANNRVYNLHCSGYDRGFGADSDDNLIAKDLTLRSATDGIVVLNPTGYRIGPAEIDASGIAFDCSAAGTDGGNNIFGPFTFASTPKTYFRTDNCQAASTYFIFADQTQALRCQDDETGSPGTLTNVQPHYKNLDVTIEDPDGCEFDYDDSTSLLGNGMQHQVCLVGYRGSGAGILNIADESNVTEVKSTYNLALNQCAEFRRDQTNAGMWMDL